MRNALPAVLMLTSALGLVGPPVLAAERMRVLIDADTANEVDDPYAIVRALIEPSLDVVGLASAQWQVSHWATPTSMEDSQRLNEFLLGHLGRTDLPHPRGAAARLFDWGQDLAQHSAAAYFLIEQARATPPGEKLTLAVLGASTNVASALLIDPTIAPKIRVHFLGTGYDQARGAWHRLDFNVMNDPRALHVMLEAEGLELHIMPVTVSGAMRFEIEEVRERFRGRAPLLDFLVDRWERHVDAGRLERTIWDLSVIEALIHPELAAEIEVQTPPENTPRKVWMYSSIDAAAMKADFFAAVEEYFE
ncbi:MAG: nucleoside hydrolase [Acidobacteriota bacterium]|jgi:inosine-uridine nucleoside N-ribohydrolase